MSRRGTRRPKPPPAWRPEWWLLFVAVVLALSAAWDAYESSRFNGPMAVTTGRVLDVDPGGRWSDATLDVTFEVDGRAVRTEVDSDGAGRDAGQPVMLEYLVRDPRTARVEGTDVDGADAWFFGTGAAAFLAGALLLPFRHRVPPGSVGGLALLAAVMAAVVAAAVLFWGVRNVARSIERERAFGAARLLLADGYVESVVSRDLSSNGAFVRYAVDGREHRGELRTGWELADPGSVVSVEYVVGAPHVARLAGTRPDRTDAIAFAAFSAVGATAAGATAGWLVWSARPPGARPGRGRRGSGRRG